MGPVMDEGRAADSEAIREEDRRIRRLQVVVFLALRTISQDQITYAQARAALDGTRALALHLFPGKALAFDLIYRPRLQRAIAQRFRVN